MRTCTQSGLLLKSDKPATPLDVTFLPPRGEVRPQIIQVWDTFTAFDRHRLSSFVAARRPNSLYVQLKYLFSVCNHNYSLAFNSWHYVFAANLTSPFTVVPRDIDASGRFFHVVNFFALANGTTARPALFDDTHPLTLILSAERPPLIVFGYYTIAPVLESGLEFIWRNKQSRLGKVK